jgi:hypothetical protein
VVLGKGVDVTLLYLGRASQQAKMDESSPQAKAVGDTEAL